MNIESANTKTMNIERSNIEHVNIKTIHIETIRIEIVNIETVNTGLGESWKIMEIDTQSPLRELRAPPPSIPHLLLNRSSRTRCGG